MRYLKAQTQTPEDKVLLELKSWPGPMSDPSHFSAPTFVSPPHPPLAASHFLAALCFQVENYFRSFMMRKLYENHGEFALQGMPEKSTTVASGLRMAGIRILYICICSIAICEPDQGSVPRPPASQRPPHNETSFCFCFQLSGFGFGDAVDNLWYPVVPLLPICRLQIYPCHCLKDTEEKGYYFIV